jgi:hypothetical protein
MIKNILTRTVNIAGLPLQLKKATVLAESYI